MVPEVRYQVFVSSTFEDLRAERNAAVTAILRVGHIPVGMELFPAANDSQWAVIKRAIDECDYYLVIVAKRYGSLDGEISYTEKEYDYAIAHGIPVLGFVLEDGAAWPTDREDAELARIGKLRDFRAKVRSRQVDHWSTSGELHGKVGMALAAAIKQQPRVGWVRASSAASPEMANEIARLSAENSRLRAAAATFGGNAVAAWKEVLEDLDDCAETLESRTGGHVTPRLKSQLRKADQRIKRLELDLRGLDADLLAQAKAILDFAPGRNMLKLSVQELRDRVLQRHFERENGPGSDPRPA